jgi:hypothetical protein
MRIAVIGRGNIGATLGQALAAAGYDVVFGARAGAGEPDGKIPVAGIGDAIGGADAVLLAIPARAVDEFLADHAAALDGKLVIDATNDISAPVANAAAAIAAAAPGARYARAFNSLGWENFAEPVFDGVPADLFYSAADADRDEVEGLISAVGLRPVSLGPDNAKAVDALLPVWFALAQSRGNRRVAFRVLEK